MAQIASNLETIAIMRLESKIGSVESSDEKIFNFLSNFNNFKHLIPTDKVQDWESDENSCRFKVAGIGQTGVRIIEKEPNSMIKLASLEESIFQFNFWAQLKASEENLTHLRLTLEVEMNKMLEMMARKPLQDFLDKLVEQLARYSY
jgi:carbon monoxide dehydrogenase subunit G